MLRSIRGASPQKRERRPGANGTAHLNKGSTDIPTDRIEDTLGALPKQAFAGRLIQPTPRQIRLAASWLVSGGRP